MVRGSKACTAKRQSRGSRFRGVLLCAAREKKKSNIVSSGAKESIQENIFWHFSAKNCSGSYISTCVFLGFSEFRITYQRPWSVLSKAWQSPPIGQLSQRSAPPVRVVFGGSSHKLGFQVAKHELTGVAAPLHCKVSPEPGLFGRPAECGPQPTNMAVPKRKSSNARSGSRRAHHFKKPIQLLYCPQCSTAIPSHVVCPTCGHYMGRNVVEVAEK